MSLDAVIHDAIEHSPPNAPALTLALKIARGLKPTQIKAYFVELVAARIDDVQRIGAANARSNALNGNGHRRSWKHGRGRSPWQEMCDSPVWVPGQERKRTGECNREDLEALIELRRGQVNNLNNQIAYFERLKELLDKYDVKYVDEIPETEAVETEDV